MVEITADGGDANNPYVIANKYLNKPPLTVLDTYEGSREYFSFADNGKPSFTTITINVDPDTDPTLWQFGGDMIPSGSEFGHSFTFDIALAQGDKVVDFSIFYAGDGLANYSVTIA
jgi:hypothetical protein